MKCYSFGSDGIIKQNKHYIFTSTGTKKWQDDGTGILMPSDCYVAPYYGVFQNGAFLGRIFPQDLTGWTTSSVDSDYSYIQLSNIDVRPYIPTINDSYYDWDSSTQGTQYALQWLAHSNGCILRRWTSFASPTYEDIETISAGTDFSTKAFNLVKPDYDIYIIKRSGHGSFNASAVIDELIGSPATVTYDFKATKRTPTSTSVYIGTYGLYGEPNKGSSYQFDTSALMSPLNTTYTDTGMHYFSDVQKYGMIVGGTPPTSPTTQVSWSGEQYPSIIYTSGIASTISPNNAHNLPGFVRTETTQYFVSIPTSSTGEGFYKFAVLRGLTKMQGVITG